MKKIITLILVLMCFSVFAEEAVLLDTSAFETASVEEYSFANWEVEVQKSLKTTTDIKMTNKGLGVLVNLPNNDRYITYKIIPPYNVVLNNSNSGLGYLENVGEIKSIKLTAEGIRKADEVILYLSRSVNDKMGKPYKFKGDLSFIGEGSLYWENPNYINDPVKRTVKQRTIYGEETSDIYIRAIEIRAKCDNPCSLVYIKNISIIYDLDKTVEELEKIKETEEIWGINNSKKESIKEKEILSLEEKKRKLEYNSSLIHKEEDAK